MPNNCIILPSPAAIVLPPDPLLASVSLLFRADKGLVDLRGNNPFDTATVPLDPTYQLFGSTSALFDGTSARALISSTGTAAVLADTGWAMEAWVFPTSNTGNRGIVASQTTTGQGGKFLMFLTGLKLSFATNVTRAVSTASLNQNQWNHVAVTKDALNSCTLWINGVGEVLSGNFLGSSSGAGIAIGGRLDPATVQFLGAIDSVRITKALRYTANFIPAQFSDH